MGAPCLAVPSDVLTELLPACPVVLPCVRCVGGSRWYEAGKRAFDVMAAAVLLAMAAIPLCVFALAIAVESPGCPLYRQRRIGKDGNEFTLFKLRTMRADAEAGGPRWAAVADGRATRLGAWLRQHRLDELPQLLNVLRGDMSLVGPRPERPEFARAFRPMIVGWDERTLVRPGITGLAQVNGGYSLLPAEKARIDLDYIERRSFALDAAILVRTVRVALGGEGAR